MESAYMVGKLAIFDHYVAFTPPPYIPLESSTPQKHSRLENEL